MFSPTRKVGSAFFRTHVYCDPSPCLADPASLSVVGFVDEQNTAHLHFYSEIPLPFPNSSYLLEPSNPMANAEMRFLRLYNNLNQAIGLQ